MPNDENCAAMRDHAGAPAEMEIEVPRAAWHLACRSRSLRGRPLARMLLGLPVVLLRDESGRAAALIDRCPHRNAPLSAGWREAGPGGRTLLRCRYHGWAFDAEGRCREVPGLATGARAGDRQDRDAAPRADAPHGDAAHDAPHGDAVHDAPRSRVPEARVPSLPVVERDGLVFAWTELDGTPRGEPLRVPAEADDRYATLVHEQVLEASLTDAAENILDVPHTSFLHGGVFRSRHGRNEIEAIVRRGADRVEAEYVGEPRPSGLLGRLFAPGAEGVRHVDRFLLPGTAQVEYAIGEHGHLVITSFLVPEASRRTRLTSIVRFRSRAPARLLLPLLAPLAWLVLRQDARMLRLQSRNVGRFGGERFTSTPIDVLGPEIRRLMARAGRGEEEAASGASDETTLVEQRRVTLRT